MMMVADNEEQRNAKLLASQIHNELQCVSISGAAHSLGVSRKVAAQLLHRVVTTDDGNNDTDDAVYQATYITQVEDEQMDCDEEEETIPCTVFRFETRDLKAGSSVTESNNELLYALSTGEPLSTAHEREAAHLRDLISGTTDTTVNDSILVQPWDDIAPAPEVVEAYHASKQAGDDHIMTDASKEVGAARMSTSYRTKKKAIAAVDFFGKTNTAPSKSVNSSKTKTSASVVAKSKNNKVTATVPSKNKVVSKSASGGKQSAASPPLHEKENNSRDVGNADDFIGDEDDNSSDDEPVVTGPGVARTKRVIDDDSDEEVDKRPAVVAPEKKRAPRTKKKAPVVTSGAMDAFATSTANAKTKTASSGSDNKNNEQPRRRRRKVMKEKNTVDDNGYFHTEMQETWEDVPSDEDEASAPALLKKPLPKPIKQKAVARKQKSLAGFFAPKKK